MGDPSSVTLKSCQLLVLELGEFSKLLPSLQEKRAVTAALVEQITSKGEKRDQNKELIRVLCHNAPANYHHLIAALGDWPTPPHLCLKELLQITHVKIEQSPALNVPDKKDVRFRFRLSQRRNSASPEDVLSVLRNVESTIMQIRPASARETLLIDYGLLIKKLEVPQQMLDCQLQLNAKLNLIVQDVENGTMAEKIWNKLAINSRTDWVLILELPPPDKNLLVSLETSQDDHDHDDSSASASAQGTRGPPDEPPALVAHSSLPEPQKIIWRLLLAHITNKSYTLSQFLRILKQCKSRANLVTISSENGFSLLHEIIKHKRADLLEAFLFTGLILPMYNQPVSQDGAEFAGLTPVDLTDRFDAPKERQEIEKNMIIERNLQRHPLRVACRDGDVAKFKEHLQNDTAIGASSDNKSCLDWAIISGSQEMLTTVMEAERSRNYNREDGADQIKLCARLGYSSMLEPLLDHLQVELNSVTIDGKSLVEKTAEYGDIEMFTVLIRKGATIQDTVMAIAAACGKTDFVLECLNNHCPPLNINFRDRRQKTALHFATERGHVAVVELLVSKGSDVMARDKRGRSFLHSAAENGNLEVLKLVIRLLEARSAFSSLLLSPDKHLGSELCFLVRGRDQEMPAWHYVHVDRGVLDIFRIKTRGGAVDVAQYGRVIKSGWGANPSQDVITQVESQFDMANISPTAPADMLPAHLAILKTNTQAALCLIEKMPDSEINKADCFGLTLLHYACMRGDIRVITALENKNADRFVTDSKGRNPAQIATVNNHPQVIEYFRSDSLLSSVERLVQTNLNPTVERLSQAELHRRVANGENIQQYIRSVLRDLNSDINNFLYDALQSGPVMEESGGPSQSFP